MLRVLTAGSRRAAGRPAPWELAILAAILGLAAWLRLRDLGLAEFKLDEATATDLARRLLDGQLPTVGLTSSIGPRNPPLFIYLISLPLALRDDPLVATAFIGVLAVVAVGLTYALMRSRFGTLAALAAAALFATAPWAVLYGRKIWPQDALPLFTASLLWVLFLVLERPRTRAVLFVPVLLCVAFQLEIAGLALVLPAAAVLLYRTRRLHWPAFAIGVGIGVLLLGPWLLHEVRHGFTDAYGVLTQGRGHRGSSRLGSGAVRAVRETVHISGASDWDYVTGPSRTSFADDSGWAWSASRAANVFTAGALALGLLTSAAKVLRGAHRLPRRPWVRLDRTATHRALLLAWIGGIWLTYVASAPGRLQPHYLIVAYPVSFALQALGITDLVVSRPFAVRRFAAVAAVGSLAAVIAISVAFTLSFHRFLERTGGTAGDYGVTYRHEHAIATIVRRRGLRIANDPLLDFLVVGRLEDAPTTQPLARVRDTLTDPVPLTCDGTIRSSGPLRVCLPGKDDHPG
jgi:4-amino-4-deoxy-L-arabinose transferase-like glycosyltransferase